MSARGRAIKHRGIALGIAAISTPGDTWYRVKFGRCLCVVRVGALSREWLDAYLRYFRSIGNADRAAELRAQWLQSKKRRHEART
jgi:hypothetical protein